MLFLRFSPKQISIGMVLVLVCLVSYQIHLTFPNARASWKAMGDPVELSIEDLLEDSDPDCWAIRLTGAAVTNLGDGFDLQNFYDKTGCVPIGSGGTQKPNQPLLLLWDNKAKSLNDIQPRLRSPHISAQLLPLSRKQRGLDLLGDFDRNTAKIVSVSKGSPFWHLTLIGFVTCVGVFGIGASLVAVRQQTFDENKNEDERQDSGPSRSYPNVMKMLDVSQKLGTGERKIKQDHNIPKTDPQPSTQKQRLNGIGRFLVHWATMTFGIVFMKSLFGGFTIYFAASGCGLIVALICVLWYLRNARKKARVFVNKPLDVVPGFTKTSWYRLQESQLNELGFRFQSYRFMPEVASLFAAFLSRNGNVMITIGLQLGQQFICAETYMSNDAYLETHSLIEEKNQVNAFDDHKVIRQPAFGLSLLELLDMHSKRLSDLLRETDECEVELTPENYLAAQAYFSQLAQSEYVSRQ